MELCSIWWILLGAKDDMAGEEFNYKLVKEKAGAAIATPTKDRTLECLSSVTDSLVVFHEEHRDAPDSGKSDYGVNYSCENSGRAACDPSHRIEAEQTDRTPVERTYDNQYERYLVDDCHY